MNLDIVKVPFTNNPSMIRLEGPAYNNNPNEKYLKLKKKEIELNKEKLYGESELSINLGLLSRIKDFLEVSQDNGLRDLTEQLEEDFVLMHKGKMEIVSVCFPLLTDFESFGFSKYLLASLLFLANQN